MQHSEVDYDVVFYGDEYFTKTDKGRVYVPLSMVRRRDDKGLRGLVNDDPIHLTVEDYGMRLIHLSDDVERYYLGLDENSLDRQRFFSGRITHVNMNNTSTRVGLDSRLGRMDVTLQPNGHYLRVLLSEEDKERLNWGEFAFNQEKEDDTRRLLRIIRSE
ncbi:MAG: hypothetical protein CMH64_00680 [Nanoarchaeota archaeon]|nr:hypothetical protein [Nanoarchaeota archaeon]|tara:strand:- start:74 stop:553 length:480 start_codon:yes stop_codon:yes gene_type:complete